MYNVVLTLKCNVFSWWLEFLEIPLFHVLNARITFNNINGSEDCPTGVVVLSEENDAVEPPTEVGQKKKVRCVIDKSIFEVHRKYKDLGMDVTLYKDNSGNCVIFWLQLPFYYPFMWNFFFEKVFICLLGSLFPEMKKGMYFTYLVCFYIDAVIWCNANNTAINCNSNHALKNRKDRSNKLIINISWKIHLNNEEKLMKRETPSIFSWSIFLARCSFSSTL